PPQPASEPAQPLLCRPHSPSRRPRPSRESTALCLLARQTQPLRHAGTLVNVALLSLVLTTHPGLACIGKVPTVVGPSSPASLHWTPAVRFRGPLLPPASSCELFPTWSELAAWTNGPRNTPCLAIASPTGVSASP
ncbi:hypothetical protein AOQ84DRAFT_390540, partial [Glonium stellatum]